MEATPLKEARPVKVEMPVIEAEPVAMRDERVRLPEKSALP